MLQTSTMIQIRTVCSSLRYTSTKASQITDYKPRRRNKMMQRFGNKTVTSFIHQGITRRSAVVASNYLPHRPTKTLSTHHHRSPHFGTASPMASRSIQQIRNLSTKTKKQHPYFVVDSFANANITGSGNPAAVVLLQSNFDPSETSSTEWMQVVAREFNLSETAFVWPHTSTTGNSDNADNVQEVHYNIRFITGNGTEVDLCGHATLASASVLLQTRPNNMSTSDNLSVVFHAQKDVLIASPHNQQGEDGGEDNGLSMKIAMDFPKKSLHDITAPADKAAIISMLTYAFGFDDSVADNIIYLGIDEDYGDILVHLTRKAFQEVGYDKDIDVNALTQWDGYSRGVIICCNGENSDGSNEDEPMPDFFSRFFGPKAGIDEDPVTGSAHCTLAPYFGTIAGRDTVQGKQQSMRGGIVDCKIKDNRIGIIGTAVTTMSGSLFI